MTTYSKGDFPFKFNIFENQNYIGPMPSIEFYATDTKKDKKTRDEFIAWHDNLVKSNYIFDFQKEMYTYCAQDVTILRLCCVDFCETFLSETGVDPFCYCTIAASVMAVYRSKYLKEKTIGIIPKNLYRDGNKPFSKSSIEWFIYFFFFFNFSFATRAGSPQQREPITVGPYYLTHPVNFPCGRKPEYPEKTHDFRQSVDYALFT